MHIPASLVVALVPADIVGPDTWPQVIAMLVGLFALCTALWKAAASINGLQIEVKRQGSEIAELKKETKDDFKELREGQKEQAGELADVRESVNKLVWQAEAKAETRSGTGTFPPRKG